MRWTSRAQWQAAFQRLIDYIRGWLAATADANQAAGTSPAAAR